MRESGREFAAEAGAVGGDGVHRRALADLDGHGDALVVVVEAHELRGEWRDIADACAARRGVEDRERLRSELLEWTVAVFAHAQNPSLPMCKVGMHVPLVSPLNYAATILAFDEAKGTYQVKSDSDGLKDWVPARNLRYSCVGGESKAIPATFFAGNWTLFVGPTAHHEVIDSQGYLVVGRGARVPPLTITADGTYVWVIDSATTIRGSWREMAVHELKSATKAPAILLQKGEAGKDWEVWRNGVNPSNNRDAIGIERMDLGLSYQGTRMP